MFKYLEKRKVWLVYIPLAVYWVILFTATSLPLERLPSIGLNDKINHFIAYFILAVLVNLALIYQRRSRFLFKKAPLVAIIIGLLYGAVDELHQIFVPGRFADTLDWMADGLGTVVGVLVVYYLINRLKYHLEFN